MSSRNHFQNTHSSSNQPNHQTGLHDHYHQHHHHHNSTTYHQYHNRHQSSQPPQLPLPTSSSYFNNQAQSDPYFRPQHTGKSGPPTTTSSSAAVTTTTTTTTTAMAAPTDPPHPTIHQWVIVDESSATHTGHSARSIVPQPLIRVPFPPPIRPEEIIERQNKKGRKATKPPNAFMIYRMQYVEQLHINGYRLPMRDISSSISRSWREEPQHVVFEYERLAKEVSRIFHHYNPRPPSQRSVGDARSPPLQQSPEHLTKPAPMTPSLPLPNPQVAPMTTAPYAPPSSSHQENLRALDFPSHHNQQRHNHMQSPPLAPISSHYYQPHDSHHHHRFDGPHMHGEDHYSHRARAAGQQQEQQQQQLSSHSSPEQRSSPLYLPALKPPEARPYVDTFQQLVAASTSSASGSASANHLPPPTNYAAPFAGSNILPPLIPRPNATMTTLQPHYQQQQHHGYHDSNHSSC